MPDIQNITQAYLGYIDYDEFKKLIITDSGEINKSVFYDNVRDYQGENDVNRAIATTLEESAGIFVLLNNGVTIICRNYRKFRYHILMLLKYDMATEKIPQLNGNKMDNLCKKIIDCVSNNDTLIAEVNKLMKEIENVAPNLSDTELTKSGSLVTQLKQRYNKVI